MIQTRNSARQCYADAGMLSAYPISTSMSSTAMITVPNEVTVLELQLMMKNQAIRHEQAFGTVLERCYTRIRRSASVKASECTYAIPPFVPGMPLYDLEACRDYTIGHLLKNGFTVSHNGVVEGAKLHISWRPQGRAAMNQYVPPPPPPPPPRRNIADFGTGWLRPPGTPLQGRH